MNDNLDYLLTDKEKRRGFLGLYFGRVVMTISGGLLGVFLPIFLYNIFDGNITLVMAYYAIPCLIYLFLVAFGAQFLNKFGFRKALVLASIAAAFINIAYYFTTPENMWMMLTLSIIFLIIFRLLFWVPYYVDFAVFTHAKKRGGQVGLMLSTITLLGVAGPMIAGYTIETYSIQVLFFVAVIVYTLSIVPYGMVPRTNEKFSWSYKQSWREFFMKKNRGMVLSQMATGADEIIGFVIWPIFIFLLFNGDYFKVGALSSFIVGFTVLAQFTLGHYLDHSGKKHQVLKMGSILYSLGWIVKIFVATAFQVFVAGIYHKITKVLTDTSYDTIFYEMAVDRGHYIDEFTVLSEMAAQVGKIIALGAVAILATYTGLNWAFVIGAISALALTTLSPQQKRV